MEIKLKDILFGSFGIVLAGAGFAFFRLEKINSKQFYFVIILSLFFFLLPMVLRWVIESNNRKKIESKFLEFTRDLVENVKSGTPISKSIINLKNRDYGILSAHVQKLANQIYLGIPLSNALEIFAKDTRSSIIARAVSLISEAEKAGGEIDTIIEAVSNSVNQIENLRKERVSAIFNLAVQGYIIFIIFLVILLMLQFKILPMVAGFSTAESQISVQQVSSDEFSKPLLVLLLIQAVFSGLVIGKISEGSIKDGIKHSFILFFISLLMKYGADAFFG
jgi:flagellar protein FlaJ